MYNGIGLTTPRGSGTNGHVQRNWAFVRPNKKDNTNYRSEEDIKKLDATLNRPPNKEILDHDRKRKIEVKCIEFEEILEKQGRTPEEIKTQVDLYRQKLMGQGKTDLPKDEFGRVAVRETHQVAEAQQEKNAKLREAFNISEYFIEGSSFDSDRKAKEDLAKSVALQKELDTQREAAAAIAAAVSKEKDIAKRYTLIRTPSKERENDGDGVDAAVTNSSDREHGIKSDRKKKKKRTRESSASNERKKDKKKKSKKHKKENKSKKKKSRKRKHSSSDSTDTDDHDSEAEEPAACSSESEREVTRKQRKKAKKEKRKRDKKKRKDRGHSSDSSRPHSPDKKSTDYKKNRRNVESSKVDASSLLDAKNSTRRSRSLERKLVAVESVHQYISSTKSRCAESSSDSRRSKDRKKVNNSKKDEKEYTPDRRGVSREHRHSERTLAERKENKDKVGYSSRQERSPSRDRHRRRNSSNERHSERSKSNRRERYRGQDKRRSRTPSERDVRRGSNEIRAKRRYDGREESRQKRQRRTRSGSESTCRVRSEHHNQHKVRRDSRSHSKIAKENTNQKRLVSPPQMELSSKKREPSQVKRVPFNPFKAAEDTINDILGTNNPFKNDKAAERKSSSSSSSSNTVDSEDVSSKEKSGQIKISIHSEADKKTMHKESARPTLRNSDNNVEKSRRSRSKSIRLKPSEINKRDKSRTPPHTPEPLKRVRETTPKSFHQPISTHSSRNSSELSYSPARRNPERYRDIMTISEKQDKNNSKRDNRSTTNDNIRSRHGNEKDAVSKLAPIVRLCTQSDDESDNEKLASLDEYQQTKREREQQELRMLEQLKSGIAAKAKQKIEMMATNGAGQTSGDPLVAALADSSLVDAIVSKVSTATVAAAESAARRSHSRTRRSQSRSRRANSRHHQRSSSRSRSRSRYSSSTSRSRSQRSSRSRTHSQSSHSSCSSRSSSGSSSSASSGSSRTGSRSPSIPRRRGSPSFLDRRRITSRRSSRDRRR